MKIISMLKHSFLKRTDHRKISEDELINVLKSEFRNIVAEHEVGELLLDTSKLTIKVFPYLNVEGVALYDIYLLDIPSYSAKESFCGILTTNTFIQSIKEDVPQEFIELLLLYLNSDEMFVVYEV